MSQPDEFTALADRMVAAILEDCRLRPLAQQVAGLILDDSRFRLVIREVVLRTVLEIEKQRASAPVRAFLRACEARRVAVEVDWNGLLVCSPYERLGADLEVIARELNGEIVKHLRAKR